MIRGTLKVLLPLAILFLSFSGFGQETVFDGLQSSSNRADKYYNEGAYQNALSLYLVAEKKNSKKETISLKLARTYFQLREFNNVVLSYRKYISTGKSLADNDLLNYAEALRSTGEYDQAIIYYKLYQQTKPNDKSTIEKIWQLTYLQNLLEDSIHYEIRLAGISSTGAEHSPVYYQNGLVFVAEKKQVGGVIKVDDFDNSNYKTLYFASILEDTLHVSDSLMLGEPILFGKELSSKYNTGPLTFYPDGNKMIFTKNSRYVKDKGSTLQLFIAENKEGRWEEVGALSFNSLSYSVCDPSLNDDGTVLYFASDMPGGYGKYDIYMTRFQNGDWGKPVNLGNKVNSSGDDSKPFIHNSYLYFSSNGHGGLGGLDLFKINIVDIETKELINLGYPINSSLDDFGIALNDKGTKGFISSNRLHSGFDDDIYEIEIDLQEYPLSIRGNVKYKELEWRGSDRDELLRNADLLLIDNRRKIQVSNSKTDSLGNFELEIPYASDFSLKIISTAIGEKTVKLEVPKNKKPDSVHDIIIVKNRNEVDSDDR